MLDRERGKPGIADARPARAGFQAEFSEYPPIPFPGCHNLAMRLPQEIVAKGEDLIRWTGLRKYARVCRDTGDGAQRQGRNPKPGIAQDSAIEPWFAKSVARGIGAKRMDEDVYVRQNHLNRLATEMSSIS